MAGYGPGALNTCQSSDSGIQGLLEHQINAWVHGFNAFDPPPLESRIWRGAESIKSIGLGIDLMLPGASNQCLGAWF